MRIGNTNQGPFHWHDEPNREAACGAEWPISMPMPHDGGMPNVDWQVFNAACILAGLEYRSIVSAALACPACVVALPAAARAYAVREGFGEAVRQ